MATMIPKNGIGLAPIAHILYHHLGKQLGAEVKIVQKPILPPQLQGSLFWVQQNKKSLFIYLSELNEEELGFNQQSISSKTLTNNKELTQLLAFQQQLLPQQLQAHKAQLVPMLIIYSNISKKRLNLGIQSTGLYLTGKELITDKSLNTLVTKLMGKPYSQAIHHYIRHIVNPEILLATQDKLHFSQLHHYLLSNEQEEAIKAELYLPKEKRRVSNHNLSGVNGGPSSGKTEVLLHRAALLRTLYPNKSILILGINSAHANFLKDKYKKIAPTDTQTDIFCFNQWCGQQIRPSRKVVTLDKVRQEIASIVESHLTSHNITESTFLHEIDFILGRDIYYENDYLTATTSKRPYQLNDGDYPIIWKAYVMLKNLISSHKWQLCEELPQVLWDTVKNNPLNKQYDSILIDDAHHLSPIAIELIKKVIKPKTGQLFITQDPNQGLLNPTSLWLDNHLDLRGHSTRLNKSYQINPAILNAATAFYLHRFPDDTNKHIIQNISKDVYNPKPKLFHFHTEKDEENRLLNEVNDLVHSHCHLRDILIVAHNSEMAQHLSKTIAEHLKVKTNQLDDNQFQGFHQRNKDEISVCHLMQTKSLHAPHVFITGLQHLLDTEKEMDTSTDFYQNRVAENTRILTMAMTRARKTLTLFITDDTIPAEFVNPHIDAPTANKNNNADIRYLSHSN